MDPTLHVQVTKLLVQARLQDRLREPMLNELREHGVSGLNELDLADWEALSVWGNLTRYEKKRIKEQNDPA